MQVKRIHVEQRENPIINRLNKTKTEKFPDLREEKEARQKELGRRDRDAQQARVSRVTTQCPFFHSLHYPHLPVLRPPLPFPSSFLLDSTVLTKILFKLNAPLIRSHG